jgi:hypothetical protein
LSELRLLQGLRRSADVQQLALFTWMPNLVNLGLHDTLLTLEDLMVLARCKSLMALSVRARGRARAACGSRAWPGGGVGLHAARDAGPHAPAHGRMLTRAAPHALNPHALNPHALNPHALKPHALKPHALKPMRARRSTGSSWRAAATARSWSGACSRCAST